jgi:hypothetical protein
VLLFKLNNNTTVKIKSATQKKRKSVGPSDLPKGPANDKDKGECFAPFLKSGRVSQQKINTDKTIAKKNKY